MQVLVANNFAASSSPGDFDLSQNKSLRRLQVPASPLGNGGVDWPNPAFLKYVLSTIASHATLKVIVLYLDKDFYGVGSLRSDPPHLREPSQAEREYEASQHRERFDVLREASKVRAFQLELWANVRGCVEDSYPVRMLEEAVVEEKARRGFDDFFSDPLVLYHARRAFPPL